jgi:hypothetical protein
MDLGFGFVVVVSSGSFVLCFERAPCISNNPVAVDPMAPSVFFFAVVLFG